MILLAFNWNSRAFRGVLVWVGGECDMLRIIFMITLRVAYCTLYVYHGDTVIM